jgi:hypothetical protein
VGKPEGKRPLERPRRKWEDGIRMGIGRSAVGGVEWIWSGSGRDWWRAVMNVGSGATKLVS